MLSSTSSSTSSKIVAPPLNLTRTRVAFSMTWWLVATVPSLSMRKPVPPPSPDGLLAVIVTTEGDTSRNRSAGVLSAGLSGLARGWPASTAAALGDDVGTAPASIAGGPEALPIAAAEPLAVGAGRGSAVPSIRRPASR